jgi:glycosyltransferase involved in cell wall biosynthesis
MRIAQVASSSTTVSASGADSVEHLVWLLSNELTILGHEVTVFAISGSSPRCPLIETLPGQYGLHGSPFNWQLCETISVVKALSNGADFDVIHSHNYLFGIPLSTFSPAPLLHTLHVMPEEDSLRVRQMFPGARVSAISHFQWQQYRQLDTPVIYNGVDPAHFELEVLPDNYLCYLGRFTYGKGPLTAIECAKALGIPLIMAGPADDYYRTAIEQHVDGELIRYIGKVGAEERNQLLKKALMLLYPLQQPEPFGLVMVEAMMCGTPVAAYSVGAVPEIIDEGVTGFTTEKGNSLEPIIRKVLELDRGQVRQRALERFAASRMAGEYERLYKTVLEGK